MIANGIVAVGDICNNTLTALQKSKQRIIDYYNFVEVSGWLPEIATSANRAVRWLFTYEFSQLSTRNQQPKTHSSQLATPDPKHSILNNGQLSLVPHAPYSVSENLWQLLQPYFQHKTVSVHNQEAAF